MLDSFWENIFYKEFIFNIVCSSWEFCDVSTLKDLKKTIGWNQKYFRKCQHYEIGVLLTYNKLNLFWEKGEKVDLVKMKEIVWQVSYTSTT